MLLKQITEPEDNQGRQNVITYLIRVGEIKVVQSAYDLLSAHVEKIAS